MGIDYFCFDDAVDCDRIYHPTSDICVLTVSTVVRKIIIELSVIFLSILRRISLMGRRRSPSNAVTQSIVNIQT